MTDDKAFLREEYFKMTRHVTTLLAIIDAGIDEWYLDDSELAAIDAIRKETNIPKGVGDPRRFGRGNKPLVAFMRQGNRLLQGYLDGMVEIIEEHLHRGGLEDLHPAEWEVFNGAKEALRSFAHDGRQYNEKTPVAYTPEEAVLAFIQCFLLPAGTHLSEVRKGITLAVLKDFISPLENSVKELDKRANSLLILLRSAHTNLRKLEFNDQGICPNCGGQNTHKARCELDYEIHGQLVNRILNPEQEDTDG